MSNDSDWPTETIPTDRRAAQSKSKKLVAYFSATGTTKAAAEEIAQVLQADLYEIKPKAPYTEADLDWRDENSRSYVEMHDHGFRPELADPAPIDIQKYDFILLGYPIWWGVAPTVVNTFLEANNFRGKTIIPFATAGSSDIGDFGNYLYRSFPPVGREEDATEYWLSNAGGIVKGQQATLSPAEWAKAQEPLWRGRR